MIEKGKGCLRRSRFDIPPYSDHEPSQSMDCLRKACRKGNLSGVGSSSTVTMIAAGDERCKSLLKPLPLENIMHGCGNEGVCMFWKKKQDRVVAEPIAAAEPIKPTPKTKQEELEEAANKLAASLRTYADASYAAKQPAPGEELNAAHRKVSIARKIITEGREQGRSAPDLGGHC